MESSSNWRAWVTIGGVTLGLFTGRPGEYRGWNGHANDRGQLGWDSALQLGFRRLYARRHGDDPALGQDG